jgi:hypothetical protein
MRTFLALVFFKRREIVVLIFISVGKPVRVLFVITVLVSGTIVTLLIVLVLFVIVSVVIAVFVVIVLLPVDPSAGLLLGRHQALLVGVFAIAPGSGLVEAFNKLDDLFLLLIVRIRQLLTPHTTT